MSYNVVLPNGAVLYAVNLPPGVKFCWTCGYMYPLDRLTSHGCTRSEIMQWEHDWFTYPSVYGRYNHESLVQINNDGSYLKFEEIQALFIQKQVQK